MCLLCLLGPLLWRPPRPIALPSAPTCPAPAPVFRRCAAVVAAAVAAAVAVACHLRPAAATAAASISGFEALVGCLVCANSNWLTEIPIGPCERRE